MKLSDLLSKYGIISPFEDIELISARTGRRLSRITYIESESPEVEEIKANMHNEVVGISACASDNKEPYLRIMIKSQEGW